MILTDREIKLALLKKLIIIEPAPDDKAFSSTAVDLTLDENISEFKDGGTGGIEQAIDPSHQDFQPEKTLALISNKIIIPQDGYLLSVRLETSGVTGIICD